MKNDEEKLIVAETERDNDEQDELELIRSEIQKEEGEDNGEVEPIEEVSEYDSFFKTKFIDNLKRNGSTISKHVKGVIEFKIQDESQSFFLDCKSNPAKLIDDSKKVDTTILFTGDSLKKLLNKKINPQLAALTNDIKIDGDIHNAMYLFCLFY